MRGRLWSGGEFEKKARYCVFEWKSCCCHWCSADKLYKLGNKEFGKGAGFDLFLEQGHFPGHIGLILFFSFCSCSFSCSIFVYFSHRTSTYKYKFFSEFIIWGDITMLPLWRQHFTVSTKGAYQTLQIFSDVFCANSCILQRIRFIPKFSNYPLHIALLGSFHQLFNIQNTGIPYCASISMVTDCIMADQHIFTPVWQRMKVFEMYYI